MPPKIFAAVMHGMGSYYLDTLFAQGRLPNIRRLLATGTSGPLLAPLPISGATWVTIFTGQSAGVHGALDYVQVDARSYHGTEAALADSATFRDDSIFSVVSRAGGRVAALSLPMTYPPWPVNGVMVSGFPLPDDRFPTTWPPELAPRLGQVAPRRLAAMRYERKEEVERYLEELLGRLEEISVQLWRDGPWDLFMTCIPIPDLAHHYFWSTDAGERERIHRAYDKVDGLVGRYMELVDEHTHLVIFSDHGGRPAPTRCFSASRWLLEQGLLHLRAPAADRLGLIDLTNRLIQQAKRLRLHETLRPWLSGWRRRRVLSLTHNDAFVDWRRTRAYAVDFFFPVAAFEVNLAGRQRHGVVPEGEYEQVREEICQGLAALVDPATGSRVCSEVHRREEMFHGPHLERIPDVIAILGTDFDSRVQLFPSVVSDNLRRWEYPFFGYHAQEGMLAVRGPGIAAGDRLPPIEMVDLAPTLLHLLGIEAPPTMEGRPFAGLAAGKTRAET
jgi:predicted AlkP superfamily phosphohydrolase/phosphomutase